MQHDTKLTRLTRSPLHAGQPLKCDAASACYRADAIFGGRSEGSVADSTYFGLVWLSLVLSPVHA